jgi:hypothetical protein
MGIYDGKDSGQGSGRAGGFPMKNLLIVIAAIVVVSAAFFVGSMVMNFVAEKPLTMSLAKNEISASGQTVLYITVANTTDNSISSINVSANAVDQQAISVTAAGTNRLAILGKGEKRTFDYIVNPLSGCETCNVLPGNYLINVRVTAGGVEYASGSITLKIK